MGLWLCHAYMYMQKHCYWVWAMGPTKDWQRNWMGPHASCTWLLGGVQELHQQTTLCGYKFQEGMHEYPHAWNCMQLPHFEKCMLISLYVVYSLYTMDLVEPHCWAYLGWGQSTGKLPIEGHSRTDVGIGEAKRWPTPPILLFMACPSGVKHRTNSIHRCMEQPSNSRCAGVLLGVRACPVDGSIIYSKFCQMCSR